MLSNDMKPNGIGSMKSSETGDSIRRLWFSTTDDYWHGLFEVYLCLMSVARVNRRNTMDVPKL